jgi:hypothetical protein
MNEKEINGKSIKKDWSHPNIFSLNIKKTESGNFPDQPEDSFGDTNSTPS